jgi:hypothetical protein
VALAQRMRDAGAAFLRSIVLPSDRPSLQHSFGPDRPKALLHPKWIVVNWQRQKPYCIRIVNASHRLLTLRTDECCAWLAFVELLLRSAGMRCHIPSAVWLRLKAQGVCFPMGDALFSKNRLFGGIAAASVRVPMSALNNIRHNWLNKLRPRLGRITDQVRCGGFVLLRK